MMFESPKSLTAVIHIRFQEPTGKPPIEEEIEILNRMMDDADELDPELSEILVQFADYINKASPGRKC